MTLVPDAQRTLELMEAIRDKLLPGNFHAVERAVADALTRHRLAALEEAAKVARNYHTPCDAVGVATAIRALSNKGGRDGE